MKKIFLLITAICLSCVALMAEPVSKKKALQIASQVMDTQSEMKMAPALNTMKAEAVFGKVDAKGNPYLYAVHAKESGGYVLVSGDDRYAQVLGYSDEGQFDADNMPDAMREWIMGYIETIRDLDAKGYAPVRSLHDTPSWPAIMPMTSTKWYQLMPYSNNLPMVNGLPSVTGCTTTAVSQLINYWAKKTGQPAGTTAVIPAYQTKSGIQMDELPVTTFDWTKIIDDYASGATAEQEAEVAKLFLYVACALKVEFGTAVSGGSSGEDENVIPALTEYFGFDHTATFEQRARYSLADWTEMVYNELSHQRPVLCGAGNGAGVGHAFLLDGYDGDGMFHVNWGWSGRSNGYFRLSVLDPSSIDDKDAPVSNTSFQQALCALVGAQIGMEQPAEMVSPSLLWGDMTIEGTTLTGVAVNMEKDILTFDYGLAWLDDAGSLEIITSQTEELPPFDINNFDPSILRNVSCTLQPGDKPVGTYKIVGVSRVSGTEKWRAEKMKYALATFDGSTVALYLLAPSLSVSAFSFNGSRKATYKQSADITLQNDGSEFIGELYLFASMTEEKGRAQSHSVTPVEEGSSQKLRLFFTPLSPGTYNVWLASDMLGTNVIGSAQVEIIEASDPVITYESINKPEGVEEMTVKMGETVVENGASVPRGILLVAEAPVPPGYHVDWYVNGVKQGSVNGGFLSFSADDDCRVEARYLGETGVIDITIPTSLKDGVWYDLQGRKYVEKPTRHGFYILNGKKIMMK